MKYFLNFLHIEFLLLKKNAESWVSTFFFCLLVVMLFQFSLPSNLQSSYKWIGSLVWLTTLFGGILRMNRTFESEKEGFLFDSLKIIPDVSLPFFLSKLLVNIFFLNLLSVISLIFCMILLNFDIELSKVNYLVQIWFIGNIGFGCLGTLFSIMLVSHQKRDLIMPIIMYPVLIPLVLGVILGIEFDRFGNPLGFHVDWIRLLVGFDAIVVIMIYLLFERIWSD